MELPEMVSALTAGLAVLFGASSLPRNPTRRFEAPQAAVRMTTEKII